MTAKILKYFRITLWICVIGLMLQLSSFSSENNIKQEYELKPFAYRLGTSDVPEKRFQTVNSSITKVNPVYEFLDNKHYSQYSYADANLKMLCNEISQELSTEKNRMFDEISILWNGAIQKSETIKFAVYKLSNPEADKPNESIVKKIITPIANLSTIAGAASGDPIVSTSAFLGGSLLDIFSKNEKNLNYKYTKINDADMIVLVRKIDDLQKDVVNRYYSYITDRTVLQMYIEIFEKRKKQYQTSQKKKKEELLIADSYYRVALDNVIKARTKYLATRATLEQLVGVEALNTFEKAYYSNLQKD